MSMKLVILAAACVVLAINKTQAFPQVADEDGIHIDFVRRVDDKPVEEVLLNYAKLLLEIKPKSPVSPVSLASPHIEMAEDQSTALCPTANCTCNITLLVLHGFIRDSNGNPTDNCTIYNVPYCEGVCYSSYR